MRTSSSVSAALVLAAALAVGATAPSAAEAQSVNINTPHTGSRPFQLDIHAGFTWWGVGVATGARFGIPLMNNGFVDSINNAVYLNFGVDFYWTRYRFDGPRNEWVYGPGLGFPVTLHWEFYFNENWSAFAEVGGQFFMHPYFFDTGRWDNYIDAGYFFVFAVGGRFHIGEHFALTLRIGSPYAAFGVTFMF